MELDVDGRFHIHGKPPHVERHAFAGIYMEYLNHPNRFTNSRVKTVSRGLFILLFATIRTAVQLFKTVHFSGAPCWYINFRTNTGFFFNTARNRMSVNNSCTGTGELKMADRC